MGNNKIPIPAIKLERKEGFREITGTIIPDKKANNIIGNFSESMAQINEKFDIVDELQKNNFIEAANNILRSQIVFAMSCVDFYMHEIVKYGILQIFQGKRQKTSAYSNFAITMPYVERAINNIDSIDWLENWINIKNKQFTYMASKKIQEAISLISSKKILDNVSQKMNIDKNDLKNKIDEIYERRNSIAHQTDRDVSTGRIFDINKKMVEEYLEFINKFIKNLHEEIIKDI